MITLELIAHGAQQTDEIGILPHVHKRIEEFTFQEELHNAAVPLAYFEHDKVNSQRSVQIANRTYGVIENTPFLVDEATEWQEFTSGSYSSKYSEVLFTNQTGISETGTEQPLFFKHKLPDDTVEAELTVVENGNEIPVKGGFRKDIDNLAIYTNYRNYFDVETGEYRLLYIESVKSDGSSVTELMNARPVADKATWKDIDQDTGKFKDGVLVWSMTPSGSGYDFMLGESDRWFVKPIGKSLIQPQPPVAFDNDSPWYIRFTNASFFGSSGGSVNKWWLPEWHSQPFTPSKPYLRADHQPAYWINKNTVKLTVDDTGVDPDAGRHLTLLVYDVDDTLERVYTTDPSLDEKRYGDTDVFYEYDISSWDNDQGIIHVGQELLPQWSYKATFYYESEAFEYKAIDLNPFHNPDIVDGFIVFYMVPNAHSSDRGIYHLVVDSSGYILSTSQTGGVQAPNLSETKDGAYNSDTVVGLPYRNGGAGPGFVKDYTLEGTNSYNYYILAEAIVRDLAEIKNVFDVRRPGAVIKRTRFEDAIRRNPRLLQSTLGLGEGGQTYPDKGVMIVEVPLTVLEDYGGSLSEEEARRRVERYMGATGYVVIDWTYPRTILTAEPINQTVELSWTWEGQGHTHKLYSKSGTEDWSLLDTTVNPAEGTLTYTDSTVVSDTVYEYKVTITDDGQEFPGDKLKIRTLTWV